MVFEVIVLSSDRSAFQALGAATMNALLAVWVLILGIINNPALPCCYFVKLNYLCSTDMSCEYNVV